jgi:hypothetical protein
MPQLSASAALAGTLLLCACAGVEQARPHGAGVPGAQASYDCGQRGQLWVAFQWDRAVITYRNDRTVTLRARKTASGFSYEGEGFEFRGDRNGVVWVQGFAEPVLCTPY